MSSPPNVLGLHLWRCPQPGALSLRWHTGDTHCTSARVGSPCNKSPRLLEISQTPRKAPGLNWSVGTVEMREFHSVSLFSTWRAKARLSTGTSAITTGYRGEICTNWAWKGDLRPIRCKFHCQTWTVICRAPLPPARFPAVALNPSKTRKVVIHTLNCQCKLFPLCLGCNVTCWRAWKASRNTITEILKNCQILTKQLTTLSNTEQ